MLTLYVSCPSEIKKPCSQVDIETLPVVKTTVLIDFVVEPESALILGNERLFQCFFRLLVLAFSRTYSADGHPHACQKHRQPVSADI